MKKKSRRKKALPRLPIGIVLRLGSNPITTKKGDKGYSRKREKEEGKRIITEEVMY